MSYDAGSINYSGARVGPYKIVQKNGTNEQGHILWRGECIYCGKERNFKTSQIKKGTCSPCVCEVKKRRAEKAIKQKNNDYKVVLKEYLYKKVHNSWHLNPDNLPPKIDIAPGREVLTGEELNGIKILYPCGWNSDRRIMYVCKCFCGTYFLTNHKNLKLGNTKSCDCLRNKRVVETNVLRTPSIIGGTYGKLVVESFAGYICGADGKRKATFNCRCSCGRTCVKQGVYLRCGDTKSCGLCGMNSSGEALIAKFLDDNEIEYVGQYSFDDCLSKKGYWLYFDFALFQNEELKCLIEYDGEQHYVDKPQFNNFFGSFKDRHERDLIKDKYCADNGIKLYRIRFDEDIKERMEEIIDELHGE